MGRTPKSFRCGSLPYLDTSVLLTIGIDSRVTCCRIQVCSCSSSSGVICVKGRGTTTLNCEGDNSFWLALEIAHGENNMLLDVGPFCKLLQLRKV